jgi:hypothetical protein
MRSTESSSQESETIPSAQEVLGTWISEVRETGQGPMTFTFRLAADGSLEIRGQPDAKGAGKEYLRSGKYSFEGDRLISAAIKGGRPARVGLEDGQLILTIDETLAFRLRRE